MNNRISYKLNNTLLIIIFGLIIYLPLFIGVIQNDKISSQIEKRNLATRPSTPENISELIQWPSAFNQYYADHFGLRELFTKAYFKIINKINSSSTSKDVTLGQDNWLFLGSVKPGYSSHGDPMGDVTNINLYTKEELKKFAISITQVKNWLAKKGIEYIFVIAPNKHTIYFNKLPHYISKKNDSSAIDQLISYLESYTEIKVIDLRKALLEGKKRHQIYYKTDTHWNYMGANIAQFEIMKIIEKKFPGKISSTLLSSSQFKPSLYKSGDLAQLAKIENIKENDPQPILKNTCAQAYESTVFDFSQSYTTVCKKQQIKALVFGDSFFKHLQPYFSGKFKRVTYVPERINFKALKKYITIEKPDLVIDEVVERTFPYLPKTER